MKRFSNILLVADAGAEQAAALKRAITLAKNNQAALTVCTVVADIPAAIQMAVTAITPTELLDIVVDEKREQLEKLVEAAVADGMPISVTVRTGNPFLEVIGLVLKNGHDLVIKCAERKAGLERALFGSTDMHLMRKCPCPVWIINSTEHHQYRRILAAVDQDPGDTTKEDLNRQILEIATSLALAEFGELHVVHAWNLCGENLWRSPRVGLSESAVNAMVTREATERRRWLEKIVDTYGTKADKDASNYLRPQLHILKGDAKHVVPSAAQDLDVDLIVMGTVARSGIPGFFMGNTAESILNQIDCSVLTVKPPGFVSPVSP